ncbi:hypothetical protein MW887_011009 [Aspergillus wentii]|nr:hypothetical protein MW887_011009 [Aspergillus wentii]
MGVPFEALIPYGIIVGMFGVTGVGLTAVKYLSNDVMERDQRITGAFRAQSGNAEAPKGFEVSNPWKLEKRIF